MFIPISAYTLNLVNAPLVKIALAFQSMTNFTVSFSAILCVCNALIRMNREKILTTLNGKHVHNISTAGTW